MAETRPSVDRTIRLVTDARGSHMNPTAPLPLANETNEAFQILQRARTANRAGMAGLAPVPVASQEPFHITVHPSVEPATPEPIIHITAEPDVVPQIELVEPITPAAAELAATPVRIEPAEQTPRQPRESKAQRRARLEQEEKERVAPLVDQIRKLRDKIELREKHENFEDATMLGASIPGGHPIERHSWKDEDTLGRMQSNLDVWVSYIQNIDAANTRWQELKNEVAKTRLGPQSIESVEGRTVDQENLRLWELENIPAELRGQLVIPDNAPFRTDDDEEQYNRAVADCMGYVKGGRKKARTASERARRTRQNPTETRGVTNPQVETDKDWEIQRLTAENHELRQRITDLERRVNEMVNWDNMPGVDKKQPRAGNGNGNEGNQNNENENNPEATPRTNRGRGLFQCFGAVAAGTLAGTVVRGVIGWGPGAAVLGSAQSGIRGVQEISQKGRFAQIMAEDYSMATAWRERRDSPRQGRLGNIFDRNRLGRALAVGQDYWMNMEQIAGKMAARPMGKLLEIGMENVGGNRDDLALMVFDLEVAREENQNARPAEIIRDTISKFISDRVVEQSRVPSDTKFDEEVARAQAQVEAARVFSALYAQLTWDRNIGGDDVYWNARRGIEDANRDSTTTPEEVAVNKDLLKLLTNTRVLADLESLAQPLREQAEALIAEIPDQDLKNELTHKMAETKSRRLLVLKGTYAASRTGMGAVKAIFVAGIAHEAWDRLREVFQPAPTTPVEATQPASTTPQYASPTTVPTTNVPPPTPAPSAGGPPLPGGTEFAARPHQGLIDVLSRMYENGQMDVESQRHAWSHVTTLLGNQHNAQMVTDWANLHHHPEVITALKQVQAPNFNPLSKHGVEVMHQLRLAVGSGMKFVKP